MKIFLDSDFRCHLTDGGGMRMIETDAFDGKCAAYIEGYRFVPDGESWTRSDGAVFHGLMIAPAESSAALDRAQSQHEADMAVRFSELGIPQEQGFRSTRNYPVDAFIGIRGELYEVIRSIPQYTSINSSNVVKTTIEHYLESIKEE